MNRRIDVKTTILPDGYLALFCPATNWAYSLPPLGALAWEFFDGQSSTEDVVQQVAKIVAVSDVENLRTQINELVSELMSNGFLS